MTPIIELEFGKLSAIAKEGKHLELVHADSIVNLWGTADGGSVEAQSGERVLPKTELKAGDPDLEFLTLNGTRYVFRATKS